MRDWILVLLLAALVILVGVQAFQEWKRDVIDWNEDAHSDKNAESNNEL